MKLSEILARGNSKDYVNRVLAHHMGIDPKINNDKFLWETEIARSYLFVVEIIFNDLDTLVKDISNEDYQNAVKNFLKSTSDDGHLVYHVREPADGGFKGGILYRARSVTVPPITLETVEHTYMGMTMQYPKKVSYGSGLEIQIDESQNFTNCFNFYKYLQTAMRSNKRELFAQENIGDSRTLNENGSVNDSKFEMYDFIGITGAPNLFFDGINDPYNDVTGQKEYPGRSNQHFSYKNYLFDVIIHPIPYNGLISRSGGQSETNDLKFEDALKRSQKIPKIYFHNCFVTGLTPGQFSYDSNEAYTTSVTLSYDWYEFIRTDAIDESRPNEEPLTPKDLTKDIFSTSIFGFLQIGDDEETKKQNVATFTLTQKERKDLLEGKTTSQLQYTNEQIRQNLIDRGVNTEDADKFIRGEISSVKIQNESKSIIELQKSFDNNNDALEFSSSQALLKGKNIFDANGNLQLDYSIDNFSRVNTELLKQTGLTDTASEATAINTLINYKGAAQDIELTRQTIRSDAAIKLATQQFLINNPGISEVQLSKRLKEDYKKAIDLANKNKTNIDDEFIKLSEVNDGISKDLRIAAISASKTNPDIFADENDYQLKAFNRLPDDEFTFTLNSLRGKSAENLSAATQIRLLNKTQTLKGSYIDAVQERTSGYSDSDLKKLAPDILKNIDQTKKYNNDDFNYINALKAVNRGTATPQDYDNIRKRIVNRNDLIERSTMSPELQDKQLLKEKLTPIKVNLNIDPGQVTEKIDYSKVTNKSADASYNTKPDYSVEYNIVTAEARLNSARERFKNDPSQQNKEARDLAERIYNTVKSNTETLKTSSDYITTGSKVSQLDPNKPLVTSSDIQRTQQNNISQSELDARSKSRTSNWSEDSYKEATNKFYTSDPDLIDLE